MPSQTRRKKRANDAHNRREKVKRPHLRRYVQRIVILRPLSIVLAVVPGALALPTGKPILIVAAGLFGVLVAGVLLATTQRRCPVCRTPLQSDPAGLWVGLPATVTCTRCRTTWNKDS